MVVHGGNCIKGPYWWCGRINPLIFSCLCVIIVLTTASHMSEKTRSPEYNAWRMMRRRCYDKSYNTQSLYEARGITVCDEWRNNYEAFLRDMGTRPGPGYSLDRINNDGPYSPDNCRWATQHQQINNRSNTIRECIDGTTHTLKEWGTLYGIKYQTILFRYNAGDRGKRLIRPTQ